MIPASIPRIVLKPTANAAVVGREVEEHGAAGPSQPRWRTTTTVAPRAEADQATDQADDGRLGDELADDPASRATDGALDADLARALGDAHGHRVDDRQATDDQADRRRRR